MKINILQAPKIKIFFIFSKIFGSKYIILSRSRSFLNL